MSSNLEIKKPSTVEEIIEIVLDANQRKVDIYTNNTKESGIYIDREKMDKIHKIDEINMFASIEWGVTFEQLKKELDSKNLTLQFPISSKSDSILESYSNLNVIIGNVRHKVNQIANLKVVLPNGQIYQTGASSLAEDNYWREDGGPNLHKIFIGSEETYGIVTKGTVFLYPKIDKILIGVKFDQLKEIIPIVKDIARLEYGEEILISNKSSMQKRFNEEISKDWCLLINFEKKYYEREKKSILELHNIEQSMKSLNHLSEQLENNWRDVPELNKISYYTLLKDCISLYEIVKSQISSFICEIAPIEYGRSVYFQYFFESDNDTVDNIRKDLIKNNKCILREIDQDTNVILENNDLYFKTARNIKSLLDKNNILNPRKWLGGN